MFLSLLPKRDFEGGASHDAHDCGRKIAAVYSIIRTWSLSPCCRFCAIFGAVAKFGEIEWHLQVQEQAWSQEEGTQAQEGQQCHLWTVSCEGKEREEAQEAMAR